MDYVTCSESRCVDRGFMLVVGALDIGKYVENGGLWELMDLKTEERVKMFGCFITVWKPVSRPPQNIAEGGEKQQATCAAVNVEAPLPASAQ
jgi:hypothetical protein